jgi:transposase-like protein
MKRTHKWRVLKGDAGPVLAAAPTLSEAARRLGVSRSTLHRWIKSGKMPRPVPPPPVVMPAAAGSSFLDWVRATYTLSRTEDELAQLAQAALDVAHDASASPSQRLAAMTTFRGLARDLRLPSSEDSQHGDAQKTYPARVGPRPA